MHKFNLAETLDSFDDFWNPRIVGELNGQHVKLAKLKGEFIWHHHEHEDELFYVLGGKLTMKFRENDVKLQQGDCLIVPRGVDHKPVAEPEAHVLLFEPAGTLNTGNVEDTRTIRDPERI